ncbi:hypothetical protein [Sporosarcina sp. HYO08]|uniref:hypothetical protein n=1 Tax=Sporosarcina sp. HYO08 TaxID=1759557 RepID=UPI000798C7A7|nr:hypothetical protein [Sporosarcina sp. HYO08]KXH86880.1 hypothetical protein AU377_13680 [Sporosarcina sp. HYO08]
MKKFLKISLTIFAVLALAIGGYLLYILKFKQYDVADEEVDTIVEEPYTIELPGDEFSLEDQEVAEGDASNGTTNGEQTTSDESSTAGNQSQNPTQTGKSQTTTTTTTTTNNSSTRQPTTSPAQPASKPTVAAIKQKYAPTFSNLEAQADQKLGALIGRAQGEYNAKKANGESVDYGYFYNKYAGAANALEANTDAAFHTVLNAVENDLVKHGYDKSYAQSFKSEYEATKKARRDGILDKVTGL